MRMWLAFTAGVVLGLVAGLGLAISDDWLTAQGR